MKGRGYYTGYIKIILFQWFPSPSLICITSNSRLSPTKKAANLYPHGAKVNTLLTHSTIKAGFVQKYKQSQIKLRLPTYPKSRPNFKSCGIVIALSTRRYHSRGLPIFIAERANSLIPKVYVSFNGGFNLKNKGYFRPLS